MASGKSSSKKKSSSSSSHKKELSKKSSFQVRRKRSRSRKRDKFKKIRSRDLSVSSSLDDSTTEDSFSMSSSDSDAAGYIHSRRKGRSRSRGDVKEKESKKRRRRSSPIGDDSNKKRKRSKHRDSCKEKKKSHHGKSHKKHTRKDLIVDSASDDSRSLSTRPTHRGRINSESDVESSRGRTKRREKSIDAEDRYNYRSRSCSPCSGGSGRSRYRNEEKLVRENHSNRLRSVLTIPDERREVDEGRYQGKDENEAEIIQAYDDYPSSKSNESYDGGRKKESSHQEGKTRKEFSNQLNSLIEKNGKIHNGKLEEATLSKIERSQSTNSSKGDPVAQPSKIDQTAHLISTQTETKSSSVLVTSDVGDLESILRQKALENFKNFRGRQQAKTLSRDQKGLSDRDVKLQSTSKDKAITTESSKEVGRGVVGGKNIQASVLHDQKGEDNIDVKHSCPSSEEPVKNESSKEADRGVVGEEVIEASKLENISTTTEIIPVTYSPKPNFQTFEKNETIKNESGKVSKLKNVSMATIEKIPVTHSSLPKHKDQISDGNSMRLQSHGILHADDKVVDEKATGKNIINLGAIRKSNRGSLVYRREPSGDTSSIKQASHTDRSHGKLQETKHNQNQIVAEPNKAVIGSNNHHETNEVPKSNSEVTATLTPATEAHSSTGTGAKGGSEFEQKTMSVMRGGEVVQVSYKVYIPKKPPALARRQLNR